MALLSHLSALPTLENDLALLETKLENSVVAKDPYLTEIAKHLITAGGKRVRPGFTIASSAIEQQDAIPVAVDVLMGGVAVELVHLGSLYHDDVMDEAEIRRNTPSVNAVWGNHTAILAGDFLLARASEIAASLGTEIAGLLARTIGELCEGQILELQSTFKPSRTEESYEQSIAGKTASLLSTACRIGGLTGGLERDAVDQLTDFGHSYGMAFQIVDDILDVIATEDQLGKPTGNDLIEGVYTLPVLLALESDLGSQLHELLGKELDTKSRDRALGLIRSTDAVEKAFDRAQYWALKAKASLESLPPSPATNALFAATSHLLEQAHN